MDAAPRSPSAATSARVDAGRASPVCDGLVVRMVPTASCSSTHPLLRLAPYKGQAVPV